MKQKPCADFVQLPLPGTSMVSTRFKRALRRAWRAGWIHVGLVMLIALALGTYVLETS